MKYISLFIAAIFSKIQDAYSIEKCYEIGGNIDKTFPVSFASDITLFPKYISIDYKINIPRNNKIEVFPLRFDAQLVEQQCSDSPLIFPDLMTDSNEKSHLDIKLYYSGPDGLIDRFEAFALKGYTQRLVILEGLEGRAFLKVKFSPETKRLPTYQPYAFPYFVKLPVIKYTGDYCLKLFKTGSTVILRMMGNELISHQAYDHYFVKISIISPSSSPRVVEYYFAETYICDKGSTVPTTRIYTESTTKMIKFEAQDKHSRQVLEAVYEIKNNGFQRIPQLSNIELEHLEINVATPRTAGSIKDAILLYRTTYSKKMCPQIDDVSYIELYKSGEAVVKKKPYIGDDSEKIHKIIKIKQGTSSDHEKCPA